MKKLLLSILIITLIVWVNVWAFGVISIGVPPIDRRASFAPLTMVNKHGAANATGAITEVKIWAKTTLENCEVATFYVESGNNLTTRDSELIGQVVYGDVRTFEVTLDVVAGDYIGVWFTDGALERDYTGFDGVWYTGGDHIPCEDYSFTFLDGDVLSLSGTGITAPGQVLNVQATDGVHTDKVVVTWNYMDGATKYYVWQGSSWVDVGNVLTWDDTNAPAPTITPGTASASDGTSLEYVTLSIAGESANVGSSISYKVKAWNAAGYGAESASNAGYRGVEGLTYQWQRSSGDADEDYSNIDDATTDPYNDTEAPEDGSGRYFKCVENATGASQQTTNADRGYRIPPVAEVNVIFFSTPY